ncbi:MAG: hypothetical protein S4CHLAM37_09910 [Chlamydiia bacterium]|nr:hypothetical protein [Chlamydiia bacterium]
MSYLATGAKLLFQTAAFSFGTHLAASMLFGKENDPTSFATASFYANFNGGVSAPQKDHNMALMSITIGIGLAIASKVSSLFARRAT